MSIIPASIARSPNLLFSQSALSSLTRSSLELYRLQAQLGTSRAVNRPSDDAVKAATILVLDERLDRAAQYRRNLESAGTSLGLIDGALAEAEEIVLQARQIASTQLNVGTTAEERASQAVVVSSLIASLMQLANQESVHGFLLGGTRSGAPPVEEFSSGFRYRGEGGSLLADAGPGERVPVTLGGTAAFGALSARVAGTVDLDPQLTLDTRLADLDGARGLGVSGGSIRFSFDAGPVATVDLSDADTIGDVADRIHAAILAYEAEHAVTILGPGGVGISGESITIDVVPGGGAGGADQELEFFDVSGGAVAQDLGLASAAGTVFSASSGAGEPLGVRLSWTAPISSLGALTGPLGSVRVTNATRSVTIDLSGAQTLDDVRAAFEGAGVGVRVQISDDGTAINVLSEVAGGRAGALSIEEVPGSDFTATRLGIRSFSADTRLADFNDGRGVGIVHGSVDPITGDPDPARDVDFTIVLGDAGATEIPVDLRPQDVASVQTLLDRINAQAAAAGVAVPADFQATLGDGANGIVLTQNSAYPGALSVRRENNSPAMEHLGLADGTYDASSASFVGADRAKVRVPSLFTYLIDLRDALLANDTTGITFAAEDLESVSGSIVASRALVGGYAQRAEAAIRRREDQMLLDEQTRSMVRDLDFAEAAVRLSALQTQLEAGLRSTGAIASLSLLDYLG